MASLVTPYFRVSYPNVFKKALNKLSGKEEYSLVALFPKGTDLSALKKAAQEALEEKFGKDPKKWPAKLHIPFRKHEEKMYENEAGAMVFPAGHEAGGIFINLKSATTKPEIVNIDKTEILDPSDFYAGCWARASVNVRAYKHPSGTAGVSIYLGNLQKVKDGDPLGSRTRAQDDFAPIDGGGAGEESGSSSAADLFG